MLSGQRPLIILAWLGGLESRRQTECARISDSDKLDPETTSSFSLLPMLYLLAGTQIAPSPDTTHPLRLNYTFRSSCSKTGVYAFAQHSVATYQLLGFDFSNRNIQLMWLKLRLRSFNHFSVIRRFHNSGDSSCSFILCLQTLSIGWRWSQFPCYYLWRFQCPQLGFANKHTPGTTFVSRFNNTIIQGVNHFISRLSKPRKLESPEWLNHSCDTAERSKNSAFRDRRRSPAPYITTVLCMTGTGVFWPYEEPKNTQSVAKRNIWSHPTPAAEQLGLLVRPSTKISALRIFIPFVTSRAILDAVFAFRFTPLSL